MHLNHPETTPPAPLVHGKTIFHKNWSLVPKRLGWEPVGTWKMRRLHPTGFIW